MILGLEDFFWARPLSTPLMIAVFAAVLLLSSSSTAARGACRCGCACCSGWRVWSRSLLVVASLFEPTGVISETHTQARSLPVLIDVSESMSMTDPRKQAQDIAEAAAALGMLEGEDLDPERVAMLLDAGQRQSILSATRLDLARGILTQSAAPRCIR
jgi:hypothetical protein